VIALEQVPTKIAGRFSETTIDDEVVVMNLDSGDFFSLAGTARASWELIDGSRDTAAIIAALAGQYAASAEEISAEVRQFLDELEAAGLVRTA